MKGYHYNRHNFRGKINKDTEVLGYDHSAPHANPVNLLYRDGSPDKIFVNVKVKRLLD